MSTEDESVFPTIRAVIFDYGQVLVPCPTAEEFGRMAEMFNVSFELFYELWESSRDLYDRGDVTAEEYWRKLATQTNTSLDAGQIEVLRKVEVEIWAHPNPEMLDWVSQLHVAGIKTGLLTNMPLDLATHVQTNFEWAQNFTFKTFSSEVRLIKPDPAIYKHTLRGLGVSANEALFIDDREANIRAARMLGMHALQFRSIAQLKEDLEALGFAILPAASGAATGPAERSGREIKFQL